MSENLHNIEDLFRDSIETHEERPPERVWNDIDHRLDKTNAIASKRKYDQLKRLSAILLILLVGTLTYHLNTKTINRKTNPSTEVNNVVKNDPASSKFIPGTSNTSKSNALPPLKNIEATSQSNQSLPAVKTAKDNVAANSHQQENINDAATEKKFRIASTNSNNVAGDEDKEQAKKSDSYSSGKKNNKKEGLASESIGDLLLVDASVAESASTINAKENGNKQNANSTAMESLQNSDNPRSIKPLFIPYSVQSLKNNINTSRNIPELIPEAKASTISIAKKPGSFYVALMPFVSKQYYFTRIETNNDHRMGGPGPNDRDHIKQEESHQSSFTWGLSVEVPLKKRLSLQTGISVTNKKVDIDPKKIYARLDNYGNVKYRFDFSCGYTYIAPKSGTTPAVGDSIMANASSSNLQYIGVPLSVQYSFLTGKFNIIPSIGVGLNFLVKDNMETSLNLSGSNEKLNVNNIQGLKKTYFNTITGLAFQYNFNRKISLNLQPAVNFALGSINNNSSVKSYPNSFSIAAGLKIYL